MTDFTYEGPGDYVSQDGYHIEVVGLTADETTIVGVTKYKVSCAFDSITGASRDGTPAGWSLTHKYVEPPKREPVAVVWREDGAYSVSFSNTSDGSGWLPAANSYAKSFRGTFQIINPDDAPLPEEST